MECPKCGYVMNAFEDECPKCKRLDEQPITLQEQQKRLGIHSEPMPSPAKTMEAFVSATRVKIGETGKPREYERIAASVNNIGAGLAAIHFIAGVCGILVCCVVGSSIGDYVVVVIVSSVASIGWGFIISLTARYAAELLRLLGRIEGKLTDTDHERHQETLTRA